MQEVESLLLHCRHERSGLSGHVRHFRCDGVLAEATVENPGNIQGRLQHGLREQLALHGKRESVPGDVPGIDGRLHFTAA